MNPPSPSESAAPAGRRWRWGRIVVLMLGAGFWALGWNGYTWRRAARQLEEAGITAHGEDLGARLWRIARDDWRKLFKAGTWQAEPIRWIMADGKAGSLRDLDALAPALRRINPELLSLYVCPVLQNVDGLKGLTALQEVRLAGCTALLTDK